MALIEEHIKVGNWLFRYRSYLPVLLFILYFIGLRQIDESYTIFQHYIWIIICFCVSLFGQMIRIITVSKVPSDTSGRHTKTLKAGSVNKLGIYSIVRHPLYLGNYFMWLGIFLLIPIIWIQVVFSLIYWIYYERIMIAEEEFLRKKFGSDYTEWAIKTPAFIPSITLFKSNPVSCNLKNIIRREYTSFSAMMILFILLLVLNNGIVFGFWKLNLYMQTFLGLTVLFYFILRLIKKNTKLLR